MRCFAPHSERLFRQALHVHESCPGPRHADVASCCPCHVALLCPQGVMVHAADPVRKRMRISVSICASRPCQQSKAVADRCALRQCLARPATVQFTPHDRLLDPHQGLVGPFARLIVDRHDSYALPSLPSSLTRHGGGGVSTRTKISSRRALSRGPPTMTAIQCGLAAFAPRTQLASWVNAALPDVPPARRKGLSRPSISEGARISPLPVPRGSELAS